VTIWPVLMFAVAGILVGGVVSLRQQGATKITIGIVAVLAALAAGAGILWMIPGDG
jgi:hypothetical protein